MKKKIKKLNILSLLILILLAGCSRKSSPYVNSLDYRPISVSPKLLLYAPGETAVDPQNFAFRSDWPWSFGGYDLGETTHFIEIWNNREGLYPGSSDNTYKLYRSYRRGYRIR